MGLKSVPVKGVDLDRRTSVFRGIRCQQLFVLRRRWRGTNGWFLFFLSFYLMSSSRLLFPVCNVFLFGVLEVDPEVEVVPLLCLTKESN